MSNCLSMLEDIKYVSSSAKNGVFSEKNITMFMDYLANDFSICYLKRSKKSYIDLSASNNSFKFNKLKANCNYYYLSFDKAKEVFMKNYILYSEENLQNAYKFEDKIISFRNNFCSIIEEKQNILFSKIKKEMESQRWSLLR